MIATQIKNTKKAIQILEDAPEDRFYLAYYMSASPFGTLFCAFGWIARIPYFRALGLSVGYEIPDRYPTITIGGKVFCPSEPEFPAAIKTMFGCNYTDLFGVRDISKYDDVSISEYSDVSDKVMALNRFESHLRKLRDLEKEGRDIEHEGEENV